MTSHSYLFSRLFQKTSTILWALVLFGVASRLYHIDAPLLEAQHAFRQLDTAAIARNFYEEGMDILYPRVDWRGASPGYVEVEFPIYNFLVALLYHGFGAQEWVGRAVNVVVYVLVALLFFRFMKRLTDERTALFAVFFYSFAPLSLYFTRSFQPDAILSLGSLATIYYFWVWTEDDHNWALILSAVGFVVAVLIKPPSLYLALPLFYLAHRRFGWRLFNQPVLWVFGASVLIPPVLWYAHGFELWKTYGNTFGILGIHTVMGMWSPTDSQWLGLMHRLLRRLTFQIATPPGLIFLAAALLSKLYLRYPLLLWWGCGFAVYILLVPRGHVGHSYYQLPLLFVIAGYMALGATFLLDRKILSQTTMAVILLTMLGFSGWQFRSMAHVTESHWERLSFARRVNKITEPSGRIIFAVPRFFDTPLPEIWRHRTAQGERLSDNPVDFYLSHRKGWSLDEVQATGRFVEILRQRGAGYFSTFFPEIFTRHPELKAALDASYIPMEVTGRGVIYKLQVRAHHAESWSR